MPRAVKVMDFGVSKVLSSDSVVTAHSTLLGTPWYMAPEQAEGKVDQMDHRTDLFSVGLIIYHMLSGKMPFEGDSVPAILFQVVYSSPDPIGEVMPDLPVPVQEIVTKAISKDREDRYQSAEALVDALEDALGDVWKEALIYEVGTEVTGKHRKVRITGPQTAVDDSDLGTQDTMCADDGAAGDDDDVASAATIMGPGGAGDDDVASAATVMSEGGAKPHLTTLSSSAAEASSPEEPAGGKQKGLFVAGAAALAIAATAFFFLQSDTTAPPAKTPKTVAAKAPREPGPPPAKAPTPPAKAPAALAKTPAKAPAPPAEARSAPASETRALSVTSTPGGAVVLVGGKKLGKTPIDGAAVPREAIKVVVRRAGYVTKTVKVPSGADAHKVKVSLTARKASINVVALYNGRPVVADVYLDGKKEDQTPALIPELKSGTYKVQVRSEGHATSTRKVKLRPGENKRVVISLKKK